MMKRMSSEHFVKIPKVKLFCQISSIRGISKINSAKTKFEKVLWTGFVLIMTCILIVTMVFLIQDYLQYTTAWHTSTIFDYPSEFPAITLCGQNPFSLAANELWLQRKIMSPSELQDNLTIISLKALDIPGLESLVFLRLYDLFSTFYMNLPLNDTIKLGHSKDIIRYCILIYKNDIIIAEKCELSNQNFSIKLFSHQEYFNCYTIEGVEETTTDLLGIILLVQLIPSEKIPELSNSFLIDILQRGEGLKLAIHEPHTFPDMENSGINMHPAKMNSLMYSPTKWIRMSTSKNLCKDHQKPINDLYRKFKYTSSQCISLEIQKEIIEKCGCMLSNLPRPYPTNSSIPYCIKLVPPDKVQMIRDKLECVDQIKKDVIMIRKRVENDLCFFRCQFTTYDTTMSITRWTANELKLRSLENLYRSYFAYRAEQSKANIENIKTILKRSLELSKELRQQIDDNTLNNVSRAIKSDGNAFTYISLMRRNFDIQIKSEKLVLDSNTLLSRIGGLTSICIGLTAAVLAEFIEFLYWIYKFSNPTKTKDSDINYHVNKDNYFETKNFVGFTLQENKFDMDKPSDENKRFLEQNLYGLSPSKFSDFGEDGIKYSSPQNFQTKSAINDQRFGNLN